MATPPKPFPLFDTFKRFQTLNHLNLSAELPAVLDYLNGFPPELRAVEGYQVVRSFLKSYQGNETTFVSYRTHSERLLLWALLIRKKPILDLRRVDAEAFMEFCLNPPPSWVGPVVKSRFNRIGGRKAKDSDTYEVNAAWRPFNFPPVKGASTEGDEGALERKYKPSQGTTAQIFAVCGSFFEHAIDEGYCESNPIRAIKQKSNFKQRYVKDDDARTLTPLQWDYVIETAVMMADQHKPAPGVAPEAMDDESRKLWVYHERNLFIIATLFSMYLRISDLVGRPGWEPSMGDFRLDPRGYWFFHVVGKGNKAAKISVRNDYMTTYMARYRMHLGLSPMPAPGETRPLLYALHGRAGLSDRQVRLLVQGVFDRALERMKEDHWIEAEISKLREASLHWLRHTSATFDAPLRDMKDLQADLRHESMQTTQDVYYNSLDDQRAQSVMNLPVRRDE
jgi:site-specific recombinase XerD